MTWWENAVPLLIVVLALGAPAPLDRPHYALAGGLFSAAVARVAIAVWRLSGLPPFHARDKGRPAVSAKHEQGA